MYAREPIPEAALARAHRQAGVVTRRQLVEAGLSDSQVARLVRGERLTRLDWSVYVVGSAEPSWSQYAWAGRLLGGRMSRLRSRSAGAVEGLSPEELPIVLGVPSTCGLRPRPWLSVVRERPGARSPGRVGAPPRTLVEDTVLDLCAMAADDAEVIGYLTTASQRLTNSRRLAAALGRRRRIANRRLILDVLADVAAGVRSPLEHRWIRDVERAHGLPPATRPYLLPSGEIADGAWPDYQVLLELDGRAYHDGTRRFRDWRRDNRGSEEGWLTLRYGWHDTAVEHCAVALNCARVLRRRGWDGAPDIMLANALSFDPPTLRRW